MRSGTRSATNFVFDPLLSLLFRFAFVSLTESHEKHDSYLSAHFSKISILAWIHQRPDKRIIKGRPLE